ncbi:hypothetical protein [Paenibacillus graminis]|uniref:hypothetical protein n=1 Tax=Paenibacillus graminis TaxID=189425 RepID=UPI000A845894|nr:hypothetical protein [Paenibacillus graminis]MEC0168190.1 hypothetical protein [Paenibacillus graminis]
MLQTFQERGNEAAIGVDLGRTPPEKRFGSTETKLRLPFDFRLIIQDIYIEDFI